MRNQAVSIPDSAGLNDDIQDAAFSKRACCFFLPCLRSSPPPPSGGGSVWWQRIKAENRCEPDGRWWMRGWQKLRDWSELVAGPKWKTFIRRLSRNPNCCCCGGGGGGVGVDNGQFRYDPLSYALNFDDGGQNGHLDDGFRTFSSRIASLPVSTKGSMDFDNDAPPLLK